MLKSFDQLLLIEVLVSVIFVTGCDHFHRALHYFKNGFIGIAFCNENLRRYL